MNVSEMLSYADIKQLSQIASHYGCECDSYSKHQLIQSILTQMHNRSIFKDAVEHLDPAELRLIGSLMHDQRKTFSLEELSAKAIHSEDAVLKQIKPAHSRRHIRKLIQRGWLFQSTDRNQGVRYKVPDDLGAKIDHQLISRWTAHLVYTDPPRNYREESDALAQDIQKYLRNLLEDAPVVLSQTGFMYKPFLTKLLGRMTVEEALPEKTAWRFGYGKRFKEYPNRFSLIYDFCTYRQWTRENDGYLELTAAGEQRIEDIAREELENMFFYWLKLYKAPIFHLRSFVYWFMRLSERWVKLDGLERIFIPLIKPFYYDPAQNIFKERIKDMLVHLGVLAEGKLEDGGTVVRTTPLGQRFLKQLGNRQTIG